MGIPDSIINTGKTFLGMKTYTDQLIPNCGSTVIMSGHHEKTKEIGFFASCRRTGETETVGPYKSYYETLKVLVMTKCCDSCSLNKTQLKAAYLPILDEMIKAENESLHGIGQPPSVIMSSLQSFVEIRTYLNIYFKKNLE
jgi:hypothetical protein